MNSNNFLPNKQQLFSLLLLISLGIRADAQAYWIGFDAAQKGDLIRLTLDFSGQYNCEYVGVSTWLQAGCVQCSQPLPAETQAEWVQKLARYSTANHTIDSGIGGTYGHAFHQLYMLGLDSFHRAGYTGHGVRLALFDAGFDQLDSLAPFSELLQNRLIASYDFVDGDSQIFHSSAHGMQVLSIAGIHYPDSLMGAAPGADFLLARTEDAGREIHLEEFYWVAALEWADSIGVDIIHSSLGYSVFDTLEGDYRYADMDGKSTIITKAAELAFEKGIFVTNSAGNEGAKPWYYITAPCDGAHVLCVGALDSFEQAADFSSRGPSADGRVKPDVMAMGKQTSFLHTDGTVRTGNGTSFSGPLIAGMAACLKQKWPDMPNDRLLRAIRQSADRYANPDTVYGYGLPNVWRADSILEQMLATPELLKDTQEIQPYPNPADGELHVRSALHIVSAHLVTPSGKRIQLELPEHGEVRVDLKQIPAGLYILELLDIHGKVNRDKQIVIH